MRKVVFILVVVSLFPLSAVKAQLEALDEFEKKEVCRRQIENILVGGEERYLSCFHAAKYQSEILPCLLAFSCSLDSADAQLTLYQTYNDVPTSSDEYGFVISVRGGPSSGLTRAEAKNLQVLVRKLRSSIAIAVTTIKAKADADAAIATVANDRNAMVEYWNQNTNE
jgi:hypothetical protein